MYPYNRNTHYFQRQSLTAREAKDPAIQELAEDDRLLALLKVATEETAQLANRYRRLLTEAPALSSSADMLKSMYLDEKKHLKNLREALFLITGETPETPDESQTPSTLEVIDPKAYLEETLMQELDAADFYRNFFLAVPDGALRDLFFEILTDKQSHANALTYLFSKYFRTKICAIFFLSCYTDSKSHTKG